MIQLNNLNGVESTAKTESPPSIPIEPSTPTYSCYAQGDVLLVLSADESAPFNINSDLNFTQSTLLIYSEVINILGSVSLPGKKIGMFCNVMTVPKGSDKYTIDVSGVSQHMSTTSGGAGEQGGEGGTIWCYVENMTSDLVNRLLLVADGGNGGQGGNLTSPPVSSDPPIRGGTGGQGGTGGTVSLWYGSPMMPLLLVCPKVRDLPWRALVAALDKAGVMSMWMSMSNMDPKAKDGANSSIHNHIALIQGLTDLNGELASLLDYASNIANPVPQQQTLQISNNCQMTIKGVMNAQYGPTTLADGKVINDVTNLASMIKTWLLTGGGTSSEMAMDAALNNINKTLSSMLATSFQDSELYKTLEIVADNILAMSDSWQSTLQYERISAIAGKPGAGGSSWFSYVPYGDAGATGTNGTSTSTCLGFDGRLTDISALTQVCAFPDQCQMLLNLADGLFFTNDANNLPQAGKLYERLVRRLAFVSTLYDPATPSTVTSNLSSAYSQIESSWKLTYAVKQQLISISSQATMRLNYLLNGYDMFGNQTNFAPRLSYKFYKDDVDGLIEYIKSLEKTVSQFGMNRQNQANAATYIDQGLVANKDAKQQADIVVNFLTGNDGLLTTTAYKIATFSPQLKQQRQNIQESFDAFQQAIESKIGIDIGTILDAFASVAIAPSTMLAGATILDQGYKAFTSLKDIQGNVVQKDYIIDQITTCENSLQSLSEAYSTNRNGTLTADDPQALKIVTIQANFDSIIQQFKNAVPKQAADLSSALDTYVNTIVQRNQALLQYNITLSMIDKAQKDSAYHEALVEQLGSAQIAENPELPFIYYWLHRLIDRSRLDCMERLSYAARSIRFWDLTTEVESMEYPSALQASDVLQNNAEQLQTFLEDAETLFEHKSWSFWPTGNQLGLTYTLSDDEVDTLKASITHSQNGTKVYSAQITFDQTSPTFAGMANVRLSQVRFWIPGIKSTPDSSGRQIIKVNIQHIGKETIVVPSGSTQKFVHDTVDLQFAFNAALLNTMADATKPGVAFSTQQSLSSDYTGGNITAQDIAPLGPLTTWWIIVSESDNPGLDLTDVVSSNVGATLEFWGRNMPLES